MDLFRSIEYSGQFFVYTDLRWSVLLGACCYVVIFLMQAYALYVIAKREGYKNRWMAFVPVLSSYYIGVCSQKTPTRFVKTKTLAIILASVEGALCILNILYYIGFAVLLDNGLLVSEEGALWNSLRIADQIPSRLAIFGGFYEIVGKIAFYCEFVWLVPYVLVLNAFFQTYSSSRYYIFTIFCVFFPIAGVFFFLIRNNRGVNYYEYMSAEQARRYNAYRQSRGYDPYNRFNNPPPPPSSRPSYGERPRFARSEDDPFSGTPSKSRDDDPFA